MSKLLEVQIDNISLFKKIIGLLKNIHNDVTFEFTRTGLTNDKMNEIFVNDDESAQDMRDTCNEQESDNMPQKRKNTTSTTQNKRAKRMPAADDGGYLKIMDINTTKTLLTSFKLKKFVCDFDLYDVSINLSELYSFLKNDDCPLLTISIDKEKENVVLFEYGLFTWPYVQANIDKKTYKIPPIEYNAIVVMNSDRFYQICQGMKNMSGYVDILVQPGVVTFTCFKDSITHTFTYKGTFEVQHLLQFAQCKNITTDIKLFLKKNIPLTFAVTDDRWGKLLFALSPIEDTS